MAALGATVILLSTIAQAGACSAQGRPYPQGAQVEAYRVTGVRTRTAVPVYVVCRGGVWVWPSTGIAVVRVR
jgi:hypothetical protein